VYRLERSRSLLFRRIFIVVSTILIFILAYRIVTVILSYLYLENVVNTLELLYIPSLSIVLCICTASIIEEICILYLDKAKLVSMLGYICDILYSISFIIPIFLIPDKLFSKLGLQSLKLYIIPLVCGIAISSIVYSRSVISSRDVKCVKYLIATILLASTIPLIVYFVDKIVNLSYRDVVFISSFISIPCLSYFGEKYGDRRRVIYSIVFIVFMLLLLLIYFIYARPYIYNIVISRSHNVNVMNFIDAGLISLIVLISLASIYAISGKIESPLLVEIANPYEVIRSITLDYVGEKVVSRFLDFVRSGDKKHLICSLVELFSFDNYNVEILEKVVDIIMKYEDLKVPTLASRWHVVAIGYRNVSRRIALLYAIVNIVKGREVDVEHIEEISKKVFRDIPSIFIPGLVPYMSMLLIPCLVLLAIFYKISIVLYLIPLLTGLMVLFSDLPVLLRRCVVRDFIDMYKSLKILK